MRTLPYLALAATLHAASVETALLGRVSSGQPILTASDQRGNIVVATANPPCGFLQEACQPISVAKLAPDGKIMWRRGVGEASWRLFLSALAVDASGNIVLGANTNDPNLPVVRPVQARFGGINDTYLMQLSPDAASTTFATYLGGIGPDELASLRTGPAGEIIAVIQTNSPDFRYTAQVGPALPPTGSARWNALVRIVPSTGVQSYALGSPFNGLPADFAVTAAGTVRWIVPDLTPGQPSAPPGASILDVRPDGTRSRVTTSLPPQATAFRGYSTPDGSLWLTGTASGAAGLATPNAFRSAPSTLAYTRIEDRQRVSPPGVIQRGVVRFLLADTGDRNRIFASTTAGLLRSDDNGWSWTTVNTIASPIAMAFGAGRLWLAVPAPGRPVLTYSDDGGTTFTEATLPAITGGPINLAAHPTDKNVAFLAAGPAFHTTRDSGETWTQRQFSATIFDIAVDPSVPDTLALVTLGTVGPAPGPPVRTLHVSEDGGRSFPRTAVQSGTQSAPLATMQFDPSEPGRLYYAIDSGIQSVTKETLNQPETFRTPFGLVLRLGFLPGAAGVILAMGLDGSLHRSSDGGRVWSLLSPAPPRGPAPLQMTIGAGGVVHVAHAAAPENFAAKVGPGGELVYFTFLGAANSVSPDGGAGLFVDASGRATIAGLTTDPEFPAERLRGDTSGLPPNLPGSTNSPDVFVLSLAADGSLLGASVLAGTFQETLFGVAPGQDGTALLLGVTSSPDFPGLGSARIDPADGFWVFLSRFRP